MPKINLPGLNRKKGSPEDLNFQCMDDGSVISDDMNHLGLSGMLEAQKPIEKKNSAQSSSVSVFARLKTLGTRTKKNKSDDTVITCLGPNGAVEEEDEEDSSSSSSSEELYQYGKTKLPDTLMDLGDESSTEDDNDDPLQYIPSNTSKLGGTESVMPASNGLRRPSLLGGIPETGAKLDNQHPRDDKSSLHFMETAPRKKISSSASVMPSSNGAKVSRPGLLAAPSGRGDFATHLSPQKDAVKVSRPTLLTAPSGRGDFAPDLSPQKESVPSVMTPESSDDAVPPPPRPKLLPEPSNRGDMMAYVSPVRRPKPTAPTSTELPIQQEDDDEEEEAQDVEENEDEQGKEQELQQRRRPRRRGDGTLRNSGAGSAQSAAVTTTTDRQPRRRTTSRSGTAEEGADKSVRRRNAPRSSNVNNHTNNQEGNNEDVSSGTPASTSLTSKTPKQKMRKKPNESKEIEPKVLSKDRSRPNKKSSSNVDTGEFGPMESQVPASPRRRPPPRDLNDDSNIPYTPSQRSRSKSHPEKNDAGGSEKAAVPPNSTPEEPPKVPSSPGTRKRSVSPRKGAKSKLSKDSSLMYIFENDAPEEPPKVPSSAGTRKRSASPRKGAKSRLSKESSLMCILENDTKPQAPTNQTHKLKHGDASVCSQGGFLVAPPTKTKPQNKRAQMKRVPSCSNFQMDAAVEKGGQHGKASRNLLGNHLEVGDNPKARTRSSATVTGHDITDQTRRIDRRPKSRERKMDGSASVMPMPTAPPTSHKKEDDIVGKAVKENGKSDLDKTVETNDSASEEEDIGAMKEELLGFLSASQHAKRRASMSDVPTGDDDKEHDARNEHSGRLEDSSMHRGSRRHSLSSVHEEVKSTEKNNAPGKSETEESNMERFFEKKKMSGGPKRRDAQSVIVGKSTNPQSRGPRAKSKTLEDTDLRGDKAVTHRQPIAKSPPPGLLTKEDLADSRNSHPNAKGPSAEANPYGKKSSFDSEQRRMKEDDEENDQYGAAKKSATEASRKKPTAGRNARTEGARLRKQRRNPAPSGHPTGGIDDIDEGGRTGAEGKDIHPSKTPLPAKSPRMRSGNPRRPNERRPHRGSPTSVINTGNSAATNKRRNSLGSKIRADGERAPPARSKSDDLVSLSSNHDEKAGAGVAAQLNFLPNDGDIGVKYNDVVSVLGESWRMQTK